MRLLKGRRFLGQFSQTILQKLPHLVCLLSHRLPQTIHHLLQKVTQQLISHVLEFDLTDIETIHLDVIRHLLQFLSFHADHPDVELPLLNAFYFLGYVAGCEVGNC